MIIYFEDGSIRDKFLYVNGEEQKCIKVDAGFGFSNCRKDLKHIQKNYPFNTKVYTNSLDAFSNFWCWDTKKNTPMIYIRNKWNQWQLIDELTERELRVGHNLEKLYINGEFGHIDI